MYQKKILVISHDATRTGAPILLIHFLKGIKSKYPDLAFDFILGNGGPLLQEFNELGRTLVLNPKVESRRPLISGMLKRIVGKFNTNANWEVKLKKFVTNDYNLVLSNTLTNGFILNALGPVKCKIVTFVHELENSIKIFTHPEALKYNIDYSDYFLVPSRAVQHNLKVNHQIATNKLFFQPYYIPSTDISEMSVSEIKKELGCEHKHIVGSIGTSDWRKGIDLFIQTALLFKNTQNKDVKFLWVGAAKEGSSYDRLMYDIAKSGLSEDVIIVGSVENPLSYLACMDVFLMISREDPYPLVVLEAAMLKKPIICFDNAGGASEFLADNVGLIVPYMNILAMVGKVSKMIDSKTERERYGSNAWQKYLNLHSEFSALDTFVKQLEKFQS